MNRYRVTLTAMLADSRDYEVTAENKAKAWDAAEDQMMLDLPQLEEIRRDEIELIAMDTFPGNEPEPHALTYARELIEQLLDEADEAVDHLREQADCAKGMGKNDLAGTLRERADEVERTIANANNFLSSFPPSPPPAATPEPVIGGKVLLQVEARADTDDDDDVVFPAPSEWVVIGRRELPAPQGVSFTIGHATGAVIHIDQTDVVNGRYPWVLLP